MRPDWPQRGWIWLMFHRIIPGVCFHRALPAHGRTAPVVLHRHCCRRARKARRRITWQAGDKIPLSCQHPRLWSGRRARAGADSAAAICRALPEIAFDKQLIIPETDATPFTAVLWLKSTPVGLLMVKLFNVEALVPPMVCRALPLKFIVPLFAVNVPLLLKLPAKFIVPEVATSVPALAVRLLSVTVLLPKLKVPLPAFVKFKVPVESVPPTVSMFALTVT